MEKTILKIFPILSYMYDFINMISDKISNAFFKGEYSTIILIVLIISYICINILIVFLVYNLWCKNCNTENNSDFFIVSQSFCIISSILVFISVYLYQEKHKSIIASILLSIAIAIFLYAIVKNFIIHGAIKGFILSLTLIFISIISYPTLYLIIHIGVILLVIALIYNFFSKSEYDEEIFAPNKISENDSENSYKHWYDERKYVYDENDNKYKVGRSGEYIQDKEGNWRKVNRDDDNNPYLGNDGWVDNDKNYLQ